MSLEQIQMRDKIKSEQAAEKGITLIRVPFWWDFQPDRSFPLFSFLSFSFRFLFYYYFLYHFCFFFLF